MTRREDWCGLGKKMFKSGEARLRRLHHRRRVRACLCESGTWISHPATSSCLESDSPGRAGGIERVGKQFEELKHTGSYRVGVPAGRVSGGAWTSPRQVRSTREYYTIGNTYASQSVKSVLAKEGVVVLLLHVRLLPSIFLGLNVFEMYCM